MKGKLVRWSSAAIASGALGWIWLAGMAKPNGWMI
jgi:hypothetical protein